MNKVDPTGTITVPGRDDCAGKNKQVCRYCHLSFSKAFDCGFLELAGYQDQAKHEAESTKTRGGDINSLRHLVWMALNSYNMRDPLHPQPDGDIRRFLMGLGNAHERDGLRERRQVCQEKSGQDLSNCNFNTGQDRKVDIHNNRKGVSAGLSASKNHPYDRYAPIRAAHRVFDEGKGKTTWVVYGRLKITMTNVPACIPQGTCQQGPS